MTTTQPRITPFLWFDRQAEEAVALYTSVFPSSKVLTTTRYERAGAEQSGLPEGSVMTVEFELDGQRFTALNGGPHFKFNEAVSLVVSCANQAEVDHYWTRLGEGGDPAAQQCGWLKDRYGLSWQIVPTALNDLMTDPDPERAKRATQAMLSMKKLDVAALQAAADGR
jgi:predicted 3-demethylubiquinone-9 3-methyltransferase (glyoxalase superfamily)